MITTTQYVECYRKTDKNGKFYYAEKWVDTDFINCKVVDERVVFSVRCSKAKFEERIRRTNFLQKSENHIIFEN